MAQRLNYVLVDYENIKALDFKDLDREDVRVFIFLGSNQTKLPSDLVLPMQALGQRGQYVQISGNGPNALDFHIAFTIGELCTKEPANFYVISKDTGFDPLLTYLKNKKILARRYRAIAEMPLVQASQPKSPKDRVVYLKERMNTHKLNRPRTVKTLTNFAKTVFGGQLADGEAEAVVNQLFSSGFAKCDGEKVTYPG